MDDAIVVLENIVRRIELGQPLGELRLHRAVLVRRGGLGQVVGRLALRDRELAIEPVEQAPVQLQTDLALVEKGVVVRAARVPAGGRAEHQAGPVRGAGGAHVGAGRIGAGHRGPHPRRLRVHHRPERLGVHHRHHLVEAGVVGRRDTAHLAHQPRQPRLGGGQVGARLDQIQPGTPQGHERAE